MVFRILFLTLFSLPVLGAELEGVRLDDRIKVGGQELQLNGIALRTRYAVFKVYVAGLYLPQKTASARAALDAEVPKRIILVMVRDASAEQFIESIDAALHRNNSEAQLAEVKPQIDELYAKIRALREAKSGTRIALDYAPANGTTLSIDGAAQGASMKGAAFYRALLGSWLGEKPVQEDMKKALLGG